LAPSKDPGPAYQDGKKLQPASTKGEKVGDGGEKCGVSKKTGGEKKKKTQNRRNVSCQGKRGKGKQKILKKDTPEKLCREGRHDNTTRNCKRVMPERHDLKVRKKGKKM